MGPATITVIDRSNPLEDVVEAHRDVDTQKKTRNVVLIFDAARRGRLRLRTSTTRLLRGDGYADRLLSHRLHMSHLFSTLVLLLGCRISGLRAGAALSARAQVDSLVDEPNKGEPGPVVP